MRHNLHSWPTIEQTGGAEGWGESRQRGPCVPFSRPFPQCPVPNSIIVGYLDTGKGVMSSWGSDILTVYSSLVLCNLAPAVPWATAVAVGNCYTRTKASAKVLVPRQRRINQQAPRRAEHTIA